jgi:hypothetical protein
MMQPLGKGFQSRLGDVVGEIARRVGDPLLRAGIDDLARRPLRDHARQEEAHAVDDAPEVHVQRLVPIRERRRDAAADAGGGVVHQQPDLAEPAVDRVPECLEILGPCHVGGDGQHVLGSVGRELRDRLARGLKVVGRDVGQAHLHAQRGEPLRRRKPDPHGRAGDDGDAALGQCGVSHG